MEWYQSPQVYKHSGSHCIPTKKDDLKVYHEFIENILKNDVVVDKN